jgi:tetratricopeptide (TPR) repeat protein
MGRVAWIAAWALAAGACTPANQERLRDYTQDGLVLYKQGDYGHARETFQAALALQPGDPNLLYNLGQCSEQLGQYARAEQHYEQCLQATPNHAECRLALASLLLRENRRPEAVKMVEQWLGREPKLGGPYAVDGWLWRQCGDLPRAQGRLQQALLFEPNNTLALTELGQLYETMGRPDRACVLYERCLQVKPDQPALRDRLASLKREGATRPRPD